MKDEPAKLNVQRKVSSKAPESFRAPFIQEVSGVYTSPFSDTNELEMALRARKVSGAFPGGNFTDPKPYFKI